MSEAKWFAAGSEGIEVLTRGQGQPLLVFHDEMGYPGPLLWEADLAQQFELHIPLAPGFGAATRCEWLSSVRDLACLYARLAEKLFDDQPVDVVGFSLGGWIAAEMLANDRHLFRRMTLVAPLGIKPTDGVILDAFELSHRDHLAATVADAARAPEFDRLYGGAPTPAQIEALDDARAETARLAWQPWLHNPSLPFLLAGMGSRVPVQILWGECDAVIPESAMRRYVETLGECRYVKLPDSGHRPEIEQRNRFIAAVREFHLQH
tara:strand:+ start:55 stop:846 length:792 start_codon:yes stop_codon:yes gene_type:complete